MQPTRAAAARAPGARRRQATAAASDPALERDSVEFLAALTDLARSYQFRDRDVICYHDLTVSQCYALKAIVNRPGGSLNGVAAELHLDKSTTSRVVGALERQGYVQRSPRPGDSRAVRLVATASGKRLLARVERGLLEEQRELLAGFRPEVRRSMIQLLVRLARATAERMGRSCAPPPVKP